MSNKIRPIKIKGSDNVGGIEFLLENKPMQTNFTEDDCAVIRKDEYILADFGKELCGGIMLSIQKVS